MKTYLFYEGIKQLADTLRGDESICLAIRPYGFHAGNEIPFTIYPQILCEEMIKRNKIPQFKIYVVSNDWEQMKLKGPDPKLYPFNVVPIGTTLQYTQDPEGVYSSIVDRWAPIIEKEVEINLKAFRNLKIIPVRYSSFKKDACLIDVLSKTLRQPEIFLEILKENTNKTVLDYPYQFAIAVCPICHQTQGETTLHEDRKIRHFCRNCFEMREGDLLDFDFWLYHTPLALPRYKILDIDLCITGADKLNESDYSVRDELIKAYDINLRMPDVLYSPLVTDDKGVTMGKSRGNATYVNIEKLMKHIRSHLDDKVVKI